jgi:BMFP domain-containing protein YqiC
MSTKKKVLLETIGAKVHPEIAAALREQAKEREWTVSHVIANILAEACVRRERNNPQK